MSLVLKVLLFNNEASPLKKKKKKKERMLSHLLQKISSLDLNRLTGQTPAGDFKTQCCANQLATFPLHLSVPICVLAWSMAPPPRQNLGDVPDSALGGSSDFQVGETLPTPPSA